MKINLAPEAHALTDPMDPLRMLNHPLAVMFIASTILVVILMIRVMQQNRIPNAWFVVCITAWLLLQGAVSYAGFYENFSLPPRLFLTGVGPALLVIVFLLMMRNTRMLIHQLSPGDLAWIHVVRIPVEAGLFMLYAHKVIPEYMTFEGRNFDIIAGITAPMVAIAYKKQWIGNKALLIWNFICLGLLLNIVIHAIICAPFPVIQQMAFDQPNLAVFSFPYAYLPTVIVPIVLFSHLAAIMILLKKKNR